MCIRDSFSGEMIILGGLSQVMTAVEEVVKFFRDELHFDVCETVSYTHLPQG